MHLTGFVLLKVKFNHLTSDWFISSYFLYGSDIDLVSNNYLLLLYNKWKGDSCS